MTTETTTAPRTADDAERVAIPPRFDLRPRTTDPVFQAMRRFTRATEEQCLERSLMELVKIRASQINGCAYCIDMHTLDAEARGESHQRMHTLAAWREAPFFTARERAALAYAEAATTLDHAAIEAALDAAEAHFGEDELVALVWVVAMANTWNRVAIPARATPGRYTPGRAS
ncbi:carboxymuconolactone decarboxylase family protein [Pseudonocardia adelaidensis]|uniref:Carboxymuconolactone decarboxylase family protein n=1 Tax=Pseudonocardia adelaidensis TaxID=648754 RepID=A0ABP9NJR7_9PSEU